MLHPMKDLIKRIREVLTAAGFQGVGHAEVSMQYEGTHRIFPRYIFIIRARIQGAPYMFRLEIQEQELDLVNIPIEQYDEMVIRHTLDAFVCDLKHKHGL